MFDPDYALELGPTNNMWAVGDHSAVVMKLDPTVRLPTLEAARSDWWRLPVIPTLVDLRTGAQRDYPGLSSQAPQNGRKLLLDGDTFFQLNSFDGAGRVETTRLMRLRPEGAEEVFTLRGGDFLTLERLR